MKYNPPSLFCSNSFKNISDTFPRSSLVCKLLTISNPEQKKKKKIENNLKWIQTWDVSPNFITCISTFSSFSINMSTWDMIPKQGKVNESWNSWI